MAKKKEVVSKLKLEIAAGKATPAPPIGPMLGQNGIPIQEFCNEFNGKTKDMGDFIVPVFVEVYKDRTFKMSVGQPTVSSMIKKAANIQKGSANPNIDKVGKISKAKLIEIAEKKMPDLNTKDIESAVAVVTGTARSLGLEITD